MAWRLIYAKPAERDLAQIVRYIAQDNLGWRRRSAWI